MCCCNYFVFYVRPFCVGLKCVPTLCREVPDSYSLYYAQSKISGKSAWLCGRFNIILYLVRSFAVNFLKVYNFSQYFSEICFWPCSVSYDFYEYFMFQSTINYLISLHCYLCLLKMDPTIPC